MANKINTKASNSEIILIPEQKSGERLDTAICALSKASLSRNQVKERIDTGLLTRNDNGQLKASLKVRTNEVYTLIHPDTKTLDLTPLDLKLNLYYEDEYIAVVYKPAGLSVHPSDTEQAPTLVHGLLYELSNLSSIGGVARPGIVHRIDKGTSGLLVITKTDAAHGSLSMQFKKHSIERTYYALVYGDLSKKGITGKIDTLYGRNPKHRKKMTGTITNSTRRAITHWQVVKKFSENMTLVQCKLETGRTHQIRVHLTELGFPLVGDPLYGNAGPHLERLKKNNSKAYILCAALEHQLLHAAQLGFIHPITNKKLNFESPLPQDFQAVLEFLHGN